jgi:hypothetical protein
MNSPPGRPSSGNSSSTSTGPPFGPLDGGPPSNSSIPGMPGPPGGMPGPPGGEHGPRSFFGYEASFSMAIVGAVVHIVLMLILLFQLKKSKAWYFGLLTQAALGGSVAGIARIHAILNPGVMLPFIIQKIAMGLEASFIALAIMFNHTRIVWYVTPNEKRNFKTLGVPPNWITLVWGLTFVPPDAVKGIMAQMGQPQQGKRPDPHSVFHRIEIICCVVQIISISAFTIWAANFMRKSRSWQPYNDAVKRRNWKLLGWTDVFASVLITVC